ncbi:MAG: hypothetical protein LQ342_005702 [Letrouitia transgressa]|nr:MAG: hypothetical protein LQ342_005702 [Letrouitia transgressa]
MPHYSVNSQVEDDESSDSDLRRKRRKMGHMGRFAGMAETEGMKNPFQPAMNSSAASPSANPNSFAARMMAKMGYVEGQGLGAQGTGRLAPIETQVRPTGAGLGAVREKTKQAKEEEKREAAFRGEVLEDSEEEERKRRKGLKKKRSPGAAGTAGTPARPKPKYRTATEIEAAAEGLQVPNVLKSIIDATGTETKLLTSAAGLMRNETGMVPSETEAMKIARRARRDLEAFAEEWNSLTERKKYFEMQEAELLQGTDGQQEGIQALAAVIVTVKDLQVSTLERQAAGVDALAWEDVTNKLGILEEEHVDKIEPSMLQEIAVAVIHPLFKTAMHDWQPLEDPTNASPYLARLQRMLGLRPSSNGVDITLFTSNLTSSTRNAKSTTPYETMLYTLFLPPIRSAVTNDWDPTDASPLLTLIQTWQPLLPAFIFTALTHNLIPTRLTTLLSAWKSTRPPSKRHPQPSPHTYIFPWLPYLPYQHTSPTHPTGLIATLKAKAKNLLQSYPLDYPPPQPFAALLPVIEPFLKEQMTRHLLPRLASHLAANLIIDPSNQDLEPLTAVLAWCTPPWSFSPDTTARLLAAELFPKWHQILHLWLTSSPNYEEVGQWFQWWKEVLPPQIAGHAVVERQWTRGLETIGMALELGEAAKEKLPLPLPTAGEETSELPTVPPGAPRQQRVEAEDNGDVKDEQVTFRDVVEDFAAANSLLFIPLREADPRSGMPLFRLTASASGKGGAVVFIRGDVLWARKGKGVDARFQPMELGDALLQRAEGKW